MYAPQNAIDPSLAALLQTAKMTTPDGGDTVAAKVAQAAQQKMQPQGIMQGMQGAKQDYAAAAPSVEQNLKQAEVQRMMQQAMRPQPVGIEQVPAQNMQTFAAAQGGIVGYAEGGTPRTYGYAPDYEDARRMGIDLSPYDAPEVRQQKLERLKKMQEFAASPERGIPIPTEESQANERAIAQAFASPRMDQPQRIATPSAPPVAPEAQRLVKRPPVPRPPAAPAAPAAPQGGIAQLATRPTYDTASVAAAGAPYITTGEGDVGKLREAEGKRAEFEKTLPDLSAKGIEALRQRMTDVEAAEASRKERLGLDRVLQQLLGRAQGSGGAARADIQFMNAQRAAEDAFSQARLGNQQAQLLMEKAQQERQLGRFDRAIALEKDAAGLMEKARDNALKAQQIAQGIASAQYEGAVKVRGQDIGVEEGARERASREKIARIGAEARTAGAGERGALTPRDVARLRAQAEKDVDGQLKADPNYVSMKVRDPAKAETYRTRIIDERLKRVLAEEGYGGAAPAPAAGPVYNFADIGKK